MVSAKDQINKHYEQLIYMIKDIEQSLSLTTSNSKVIAENTEKISSHLNHYFREKKL